MVFEHVEEVDIVAVFGDERINSTSYVGREEAPVVGEGEAGVKIGQGGSNSRNGQRKGDWEG